jgi:methionyl-tRNA formyltransferase
MRIIFFGTPEFSCPTLSKIISDRRFEVLAVVTQPDRPAGRGQKLQFSPVKELALQHNIPILQPENIKKSLNEFIKSLENYLPIDFGVVVAFGQILPKKLLELPKFGCINIHGSILPRWRGAAPMQRAIMSGDKETGVAIMQMGVGLDTGPVYDPKKVNYNKDYEYEGNKYPKSFIVEGLLDWINIKMIKWYTLSRNPNAIHILEANPEKINWELLSGNPAIFKSYHETNEYVLK